MKKTILILTTVFITLNFLQAQSKTEKINSLINLMQPNKIIDKSFANMNQMFKEQAKKELSQDASKKYNEYMMDETKEIVKILMNTDLPQIYNKYFTEDEIDAMIIFYQSPAGKKLTKVTPNIQKELITALMKKYIPEVRQKFSAKIEELKQNG
ncbi:MAG: DUF2059 domain-containing protein [Bacteroidales bacterium]|nr:DUF2059 domain-containing protein [Bacteroidales bacterium]